VTQGPVSVLRGITSKPGVQLLRRVQSSTVALSRHDTPATRHSRDSGVLLVAAELLIWLTLANLRDGIDRSPQRRGGVTR
jgi:hypothetical protein